VSHCSDTREVSIALLWRRGLMGHINEQLSDLNSKLDRLTAEEWELRRQLEIDYRRLHLMLNEDGVVVRREDLLALYRATKRADPQATQRFVQAAIAESQVHPHEHIGSLLAMAAR
jgi:hypothetical protein